MELNANFEERVLVHSDELPWLASPMPGVERRMLDRIGAEVARATTIVRYAPGSQFSPHVHGGGEEFLVLEGVFQDEHGDYPAGSYVRNPPGSSHTPASAPGCTIFVKLRQFDPGDSNEVKSLAVSAEDAKTGVLHQDERERVERLRLAPREVFSASEHGGAELLVIEGSLEESGDLLRAGSWLRVPPSMALTLEAGEQGAHVWMKRGHLRSVIGG